MNFKMEEAIDILERTPETLEYFLTGLSDGWLECNEGDGTWNASEVIGHLIDGEKNNWMPRLEFILQAGEKQPFPSFDRFSHLKGGTDQTIEQKLLEWKMLRQKSLARLNTLSESGLDLEWTGYHPAFGTVRVRELLSTWVVHDFTHIAQIVRVMAKRYKADVGPWIEYLGILKK